ncbi:phage tail tape measure protein [Burkholderia pseudomallei]|uniref:phage tail tape measure protein n=1 Tax=Burkholderia pseudomallei TaxID=28450 RepID=UPI0003D801E5|nr:phage tail tape measure protein [Burkholderia pseudomallei]AHE34410.1 phage tail tape measure protein, lambda family [Burkholderia pseudomallei NAU20B-16]AHG33373.1 phage tail tape measure protein, lambda family [Burkholderia pseudomallei MSHR511]AHG67641.1 phage tail tape measure protein, lambda family [Burkholderia pseudomallei MSHR146]OMX05735.1 phage tail tape measure protein [Burkholderia pseudomallei]OMY03885.1 phage tail tape measure protein [Burkholderia pseudomallei]
MATSLRELIVSVTANTTEYDRRMRGLSSTAGSYFNAVRDGGRTADAAFASNAASVQVTVRALDAARSSIREYAQAAAAAFGVHQLIEYADEWTNLSNRLRIVTRDQIDFAIAQNDVLRIARDTRQPLDATAELYQRIANNASHLGLSIKQVGPLVTTISKAVALSGVSADTARMGLVQLGQAFAAGQLRGQDLNSVLEELPGVADAIARGMGKSSAQLKSMAEEGKLTVGNLVEALTRAAGGTDTLFEKMQTTVGQTMTRLQTEIVKYIGESDQATGASARLAQGITYVAEHLDGIVKLGVSLAAGRIAVYFGQSAVAATQAATAWVGARRALVEETIKQHEAAQAALAKAQGDRAAAAAKLQNAQAAEASAQAELAGMRAMRESLAMQSALTAGSIKYTEAKLAEARAVEATAQAHVATARANVAGSQEIGARITGTPYAAIIARETAAAQQELERAEASLALAQQRRTALEAAAKQGTIDKARYTASLAETDRGLAQAERDVALATQARERAERAATATAAGLKTATESAATAQTALARTGTMMRSVGSGLLAAVGGLPGILATVGTVALGAAANWLLFRDNASSATSSLIDMQAPLDQIIDKYRQLTPLLQESERLRTKQEASRAADDAQSAYRNLATRAAQSVMVPTFGDAPSVVSDADQAALDRFLAGLDRLKTSNLGVDEKSREIGRLIDRFVSATSGGEALREELVRAAGAIDTAGLASQKGAQALAAMDAAARGAAEGVRLLSDANNFFAGGMASEAWEKYVHKLREESDVIGMTARQRAEYEARTKGANDAQARMAGLVAGRADAYKSLEKAIADKDAKAAAGARTNIDNLTRELALMNQQMVVAKALEEFQADLSSKKFEKFGFNADAARAAAAARGKQAFDETVASAAAQTARVSTNAAAARAAKGGGVHSLESERMLDNIRQRIAQLRVEAVATDKLTQSQKDLLAFDQKVTDLRSKRKKLSDDDKSLLRDQQAIRGMYEQASQLEKEVRYRDAINRLKERSAQIDAELGDYAAERQRDVQRELGAMSMGDNARELNQAINRVSDEFRRRRDELTKGARKDGTLGSPEYIAEIERINTAEAEQVARERGYLEQRLALQADWRVGVKRAMAVYQESAQNAAQMAEEALTSSFRNAEDALVSFAASGKLNFRGLIDSMIADLARFSARAAMSQVFGAIGSALGFGGVSDAVGALGGAASAAVGSNAYGFHLAAGGAVWGPGTSTSDSIPAQLSNGEFVVRAAVVSQPGVRAHLERLNAGGRSGFARFAAGGLVGGSAGGGDSPARNGGISVSAPVSIEGGSSNPASLIAVGEFRKMLEQMIRELIQRERRQGGTLWRAQNGIAG